MLPKSVELVLCLGEEQVSEFCVKKIEEEVLVQCGLLVFQIHIHRCTKSIDVLVVVVNFFKEPSLFSYRFLMTFELWIIIFTKAARLYTRPREVSLKILLQGHSLNLFRIECPFRFLTHIEMFLGGLLS